MPGGLLFLLTVLKSDLTVHVKYSSPNMPVCVREIKDSIYLFSKIETRGAYIGSDLVSYKWPSRFKPRARYGCS